MRANRTALFLLALGLVVTACGKSEGGSTTTTAPVATTVASTPTSAWSGEPALSGVVVKTAENDLGKILVGPDGKTLYGFTNDPEGVSSCSGTCADAWPPVVVSADWKVGPEPDSGIFSTVTREDGSQQLAVGRWPLYYYSGDAAAGDTTGQGSGGVWFVAGADGKLIKDGKAEAPEDDAPEAAAGAGIEVAKTDLGDVLVDGEGKTLYGFLPDKEAGKATCTDACAEAWPAATVEGDPEVGEGIDATLVTTVDGATGGKQLKAGDWPLYTFSGDAAPGDVNGQGSGGSWFVVAPDGKLIKGDAPAGGDAPAAPSTTAGAGTGY